MSEVNSKSRILNTQWQRRTLLVVGVVCLIIGISVAESTSKNPQTSTDFLASIFNIAGVVFILDALLKRKMKK